MLNIDAVNDKRWEELQKDQRQLCNSSTMANRNQCGKFKVRHSGRSNSDYSYTVH